MGLSLGLGNERANFVNVKPWWAAISYHESVDLPSSILYLQKDIVKSIKLMESSLTHRNIALTIIVAIRSFLRQPRSPQCFSRRQRASGRRTFSAESTASSRQNQRRPCGMRSCWTTLASHKYGKLCAPHQSRQDGLKAHADGPVSVARTLLSVGPDIIKVKISVNTLPSTAGKVVQGLKAGLTIGVRELLTMRPGKASAVGDFLAVSAMLRFPSRIHFQFGP